MLDEAAAARFRPVVFTAIAGLVLSGIYNYLAKPGHSVLYHALFGFKMLLALHVFSVAILVTAPQEPAPRAPVVRRRDFRPGHHPDFGLPEGHQLN